MKPGEKAGVLLWQGESPLAWVDGKRLFLNWPWEKSNADRVPAPLLMTRRFMQSVQENLPGTHYGNLPGGTLLSMPAGGKLIQTMPGGERRETVFNGRLPEETGYVEIFPPEKGKRPCSKAPSGSLTPGWEIFPTAPRLTQDFPSPMKRRSGT